MRFEVRQEFLRRRHPNCVLGAYMEPDDFLYMYTVTCIENGRFLYMSEAKGSEMPGILPVEHLAAERFDTPSILKKLAAASRQLAELKGVAASIPNHARRRAMRSRCASPCVPTVRTASAQSAYALAGMNKQRFVSRCQVQSRGKKEMAAFLHKTVKELGGEDGN